VVIGQQYAINKYCLQIMILEFKLVATTGP
jgi:hypothetical protein